MNRQVSVAVLASLVGTVGLTWWLVERDDRLQGVDAVFRADPPGGPALVLAGWNDGEDDRFFGFSVLDLRTGDVADPVWIGSSYSSIPSSGDPRVLAAGGSRVAYVSEDGFHLRDLGTGQDLAGPDLLRAYPAIAAPWFHVEGQGAALAIEADDKARWILDLATGAATRTESAPEARNPRCYAATWTRPDGEIWAWIESPPERHSDPNGWALARVGPGGTGPVPLGLRVPYATFVCDPATGAAIAVGEGTLFLTRDDTVHVSWIAGREPGWTWDSGAAGDVDAFPLDGGVVVRVGARVASLGPGGAIRWIRDL